MATEIKMPQLGLTMTEGTLGAWHKKVGDAVKTGDVLVEINTDKLTTELESEVDGELLAIVGNEGDEIPVQGLICIIGAPGEKVDIPTAAAASAPAAQESTPTAAAPVSAAPAQAASTDGRLRISPLAKKVAAEHGLDAAAIKGTGPNGRIVHKDVLTALEAGPAVAATPVAQTAPLAVSGNVRREKMSPMRKTVAERMFKSHSEIPVVTQTVKNDVTKLMEFRSSVNASREVRFSLNDFILKAVAKALTKHPALLTSIDGNEIIYHEDVNIGMAVAIDTGLIVPVIKNADKLSLEAVAEKAKDLATRARSNGLGMDEYQGATFSVSNLGMYGVEEFTPIINQPNAAILGVCGISDELALVDGEVVVRKVMRTCLTYDHRLLDGAVVAKFQNTLKALLENPLDILL